MPTRIILFLFFGVILVIWAQRFLDRSDTQEPELRKSVEVEEEVSWPTSSATLNPNRQEEERIATPSKVSDSSPVTRVQSTPPDQSLFPRGPDDLREEQFVEKYRNSDIEALARGSTLTSYQDVVNGIMFIIGESRALLVNNLEIEWRRWINRGRTADSISENSCISIKSPGEAPIVGSIGGGTLAIRNGPIKNSYLLSISNKHYFLIYDDPIAWEEMAEARMTGTLLYYVRNSDGKIVYQGHGSRWTDMPQGSNFGEGVDFCRYSFPEKL